MTVLPTNNTQTSDLRDLPIPKLRNNASALDYHPIKIDLQGVHNREPLVELEDYCIACKPIYALSQEAPYYKAFPFALRTVMLRQGVAEKLVQVNQELLPYGVELLALDGFRPIELQRELWEHFINEAKIHLPHGKDDELVNFAGKYCSDPRHFDPTDYTTWPVHSTGGAIDITLQSIESQNPIAMGSGFDEVTEAASTRFFESQDESETYKSMPENESSEFKRNRRLLFHAMQNSGFANYQNEWWHFDLGTQMWVLNGGHSQPARYGTTTQPGPELI